MARKSPAPPPPPPPRGDGKSRFRLKRRREPASELDAIEAGRIAREAARKAIDTLARIAADDDAPASARVAAACRILDRGYGPSAVVQQASKDLFSMTDEELAALLDAEPGTDTIQ